MQTARPSTQHDDLLTLLPGIRAHAIKLAGPALAYVDLRDLIHDAFVACLRAQPRYNGRYALSTFHGLRIRGAMIDGLRKKDYRRRNGGRPIEFLPLTEIDMERRADPQAVDPDRAVLYRELREALTTLPPRSRTILIRWMHGDTEKEIADALGISKSRMWQLRNEGLETLRSTLA